MIARHAAAAHMELRERHLRLGHTGLGGAGKPGGSLGVVLCHAAALGEHAAVPILCVHHALSRAPQPEGGALVVARHADALGEADRVVERADQVALLGRAFEPFVHGRRLMREGGTVPVCSSAARSAWAPGSPASAARVNQVAASSGSRPTPAPVR